MRGLVGTCFSMQVVKSQSSVQKNPWNDVPGEGPGESSAVAMAGKTNSDSDVCNGHID